MKWLPKRKDEWPAGQKQIFEFVLHLVDKEKFDAVPLRTSVNHLEMVMMIILSNSARDCVLI